jgi:hypothetical protein
MNKKNLSIVSIFFGIISFILSFNLFWIFFWSHGVTSSFLYSISDYLSGVAVYSELIISILGIIIGLLGLKSEKRKLAKIGIGLSVLGLIGYLVFFFFLWLRFGGI